MRSARSVDRTTERKLPTTWYVRDTWRLGKLAVTWVNSSNLFAQSHWTKSWISKGCNQICTVLSKAVNTVGYSLWHSVNINEQDSLPLILRGNTALPPSQTCWSCRAGGGGQGLVRISLLPPPSEQNDKTPVKTLLSLTLCTWSVNNKIYFHSRIDIRETREVRWWSWLTADGHFLALWVGGIPAHRKTIQLFILRLSTIWIGLMRP